MSFMILRRFIFGVLGFSAVGIILISFTVVFQWRLLKQYLNQFSWDQSVRVYSRPLILRPDHYTVSSPDFLRAQLKGYDYTEVFQADELKPQTFRITDNQVCVRPAQSLENIPESTYTPHPACVIWQDQHAEIWTHTENERLQRNEGVELPPVLIGFLFSRADHYEVRSVARLDELPPELIWAVISIEDERFFEHRGVDLKSILRAMWANIRSGHIVQGGSTITQQLIKNMLLTQEKTLWRKIQEAILAYLMEVSASKDEILLAYLNEIYFGKGGVTSIYGVKEAAHTYFGTPPGDLTLAQSATLAAIIKNPGLYTRAKHRQKLKERRNLVLSKLLEHGYVTESEVLAVKQAEVELKRQDVFNRRYYGYILDAIRKDDTFQQNQVIVTSIDPILQKMSVTSMQAIISDLRARKEYQVSEEDPLQAAFLITHPRTGEILAMQGGYEYAKTQFNRVVDAHRQVGSTIKPFVYAAAMHLNPGLSPLTPIWDHPIQLQTRRDEVWEPKNYKDEYYDWVTLRQALENSINVATVKLAHSVGFENISHVFKKLWPDLKGFYPSSTVGSIELSLAELLNRYQIFFHCHEDVILGLRLTVGQKRTLIHNPFECDVLSQIASMMQGVVLRGTAKGLHVYVGDALQAMMGKTGTTNEGRDSWFIGMDQHFLAGVWVGFDQPETSPLTGAGGALHIFGMWMRQMILNGYVPNPLRLPSELTLQEVPTFIYDKLNITSRLSTPDHEWLKASFEMSSLDYKIE